MAKILIEFNDDGNQLIRMAGEFGILECVHTIISLTNIFVNKLGTTVDMFKELVRLVEESEINVMLENELKDGELDV